MGVLGEVYLWSEFPVPSHLRLCVWNLCVGCKGRIVLSEVTETVIEVVLVLLFVCLIVV